MNFNSASHKLLASIYTKLADLSTSSLSNSAGSLTIYFDTYKKQLVVMASAIDTFTLGDFDTVEEATEWMSNGRKTWRQVNKFITFAQQYWINVDSKWADSTAEDLVEAIESGEVTEESFATDFVISYGNDIFELIAKYHPQLSTICQELSDNVDQGVLFFENEMAVRSHHDLRARLEKLEKRAG